MQLIVLCIFMFKYSIADSAALANDKPRAEPPLVTMEAILERSRLRIENFRWANADTLIADFTATGENKTYTRFLHLDGTLGPVLGEGELSAMSPDGEAVVQRTTDGWVLRELGARGQTVVLDNLKASESEFSYSTRYLPKWTPDSRYAALVEGRALQTKTSPPEPIQVDGVSIIDLDHRSSISSQLATRISIIDRNAQRTVRQFVIPGSATRFAWGPDYTLYISEVRPFESEPSTSLLRLILTDNEPVEIYRSRGRLYTMQPAVRPDGELIALAIDADNRKWADFVSLVLIDAQSGEEVRRLTHDLPIAGSDYRWSTDGSEIYARVRHGGLDEIWVIPLDGKPHPLAQGPRRHFDLDLSPNGGILSYQTEDGYGHKDIRILDLDSGEEQVVRVLNDPAKEFQLGEWHQIRWKSTDGVKPYGYLIMPPDFNPDRQYPMLVDVHGGGAGSRLYLYAPFTLGVARGPLEWHVWAAMGYVVFVPDYRSTGDYGPEVIADRYKRGEKAAIKDNEDIVAGVKYMLKQDYVDPARVAILGHSAGGKRVYLLLTRHSEMFAAAILNEGTSPDPVSYFIYITSGAFIGGYPAGILREWYGANLDKVPERYKVNYMFDAYRNKTPTLILMGNEDRGGVDHMPYEVLYSILKQNGVPIRFLIFVDEGHTYKNPAAARLAFQEARQWLELHMPAHPE